MTEALRQGFGCLRDAADRVGGVDLDQLLENIVRQLVGGCIVRSGGGRGHRGTEGQRQNYARDSLHGHVLSRQCPASSVI
jgi:hypothetical protein